MIPSTQTTPALKYKIKLKLASCTAEERKVFKAELFNRCKKMSESTYKKYLNLRFGDLGDIPAGVLMVISCLLDCSVLDLFNESNINDNE
jgi:hypothetical protein